MDIELRVLERLYPASTWDFRKQCLDCSNRVLKTVLLVVVTCLDKTVEEVWVFCLVRGGLNGGCMSRVTFCVAEDAGQCLRKSVTATPSREGTPIFILQKDHTHTSLLLFLFIYNECVSLVCPCAAVRMHVPLYMWISENSFVESHCTCPWVSSEKHCCLWAG